MASQSPLGLPPLSSELKSIRPYLQRAEEVRSQDPVISYWCIYYATQVGISLKLKDAPSRECLFALLSLLETMKKEIGPNEAIDNETVSSAYVENFALRLFVNADNEDRSGAATRTTAKKFVAAANFLEVIKTFPKTELSESHDERIRYAKWKAADIAKAFREGRKPAPGPANSEEDLQTDAPSLHHEPTSVTTLYNLSAPYQEDEKGVVLSPPPGQAWVSEGQENPSFTLPAEQATATSQSPSFGQVPTSLEPNTISANQDYSYPDPVTAGSHQPSTTAESNNLVNEPSAPLLDTSQSQVSPDRSHQHTSYPTFPPAPTYTNPPPVSSVPDISSIELTVEVVAKAQKHCRYAISALDYEDATTARKELRAALALLGG